MYLEAMISKNPMDNVEMIKKANFLSAQGKELLTECETITILDPNELKKFKEEAYATYSNGERKHQQAAAYILMLNTGARPGEILAVNNRDIDIEKKQMKIQNSMKEVYNREGTKATGRKSAKVGKTKTLTSNRTAPLNDAAIEAIKALSPKQVADILGHTTSQITEMYYVKKDISRLTGITDGFEI